MISSFVSHFILKQASTHVDIYVDDLLYWTGEVNLSKTICILFIQYDQAHIA